MSPTQLTPPTPGQAPSAPPAFGQQSPQGQKPKQKSGQPTFLGTGAVPSMPSSGKTLLGQ